MKLLNKDEIVKAIESIKTRGAKLDSDIHVAACSALAIKTQHGDTMFLNRLYLALPKGTRKQAMTSWVLKYAGVLANTGPNKAEQPFVHSKELAADLEGAKADPWYDHKPDPKPDEVFNVLDAVAAILKKAKGKELAHAELLAPLAALVESGALSSSTANGESNTDSLPEGESEDESSTDPRNVGIDVARGTVNGVSVVGEAAGVSP